ncbi:hypothetical protein HK405_000713, partial [Cladochytrium tenue]
MATVDEGATTTDTATRIADTGKDGRPGGKVLVIGAGPAGLITALVFKKHGFDVVVYEKQPAPAGDNGEGGDSATVAAAAAAAAAEAIPAPSALGGSVSLYPNGLRGLRRLGLLEAVRGVGSDGAREMHFMLMDGSDAIRRRQVPRRPKVDDVPPMQVLRASLQAVLERAAAAAGVRVERGRRLVAVREIEADEEGANGGVRAEFADGSVEEGALLVGADGVRSVVRTAVFPDARAAERVGLGYVGVFDIGAEVPSGGDSSGGGVKRQLGFDHQMGLYMNPLDATMVYAV